MDVDETRRHNQAACVNLTNSFPNECANLRNSAVFHGHVTAKPRIARAVHNLPVANDQIIVRIRGANAHQRH